MTGLPEIVEKPQVQHRNIWANIFTILKELGIYDKSSSQSLSYAFIHSVLLGGGLKKLSITTLLEFELLSPQVQNQD